MEENNMLGPLYRTGDIVIPMTRDEAWEWKMNVGNTATSLRVLLFVGYEREAWRALGYANWTDCLQAMADEFGFTERRLWQLHAANQTERLLLNNCSVGTIPEGQLRPLTKLEPDDQRTAWQRAGETAPNGKVTAAHVQSVVDEMRQEDDEDAEPGPTYYHLMGEFTDETIKVGPDEELAVVKKEPTWYQSSESDDWWTPQWLFDLVSEEIAFETDVCASDANHKCERYFTKEQDALAQDWTGACWMNPPYGRSGGVSIYHWIEKAYWTAMQGATVACFIPARTDTLWWWEFCIHGEIRFLKGRVKFANSNSIAPFPSAVVIFWPYVPTNREKVVWWETNGAAEVERG